MEKNTKKTDWMLFLKDERDECSIVKSDVFFFFLIFCDKHNPVNIIHHKSIFILLKGNH